MKHAESMLDHGRNICNEIRVLKSSGPEPKVHVHSVWCSLLPEKSFTHMHVDMDTRELRVRA